MEETVRYEGFWRRFAAAIIDNLFIAVVLAPLLFLFTSGGYIIDPHSIELSDKIAHLDWRYLFLHEVVPLVVIIFLWVGFQTTPGKYLLACYVVDGKGFQALTLAQALLRYFGYLVSLLPLGLGFIWVAFDKRKTQLSRPDRRQRGGGALHRPV